MPAIKITNIDLVMQQAALSNALGFGHATRLPWIGFYKGALPAKTDLSSVDVSTFRSADLLWSAGLYNEQEITPGIWSIGATSYSPPAIVGTATWYLLCGKDKTSNATYGVVVGDVSSLGQGGQFQINSVSFLLTNTYRVNSLRVQFPYTFSY